MPDRQMTLDLDAALETRDAAVDAAGANADVTWFQQAYQAVENLAHSRHRFIVDDVWKVLAQMGVEKPVEARAMGAVLRRAQREGIIEPTGGLRRSAQVQCHGNRRQVWKSLVCRR